MSSTTAKELSNKFVFAIDRGGTFTDVWARCPGGDVRVMKLLSEDPRHYRDAPTEAIRRIIEQETGVPMPRGCPVKTDNIGWIRMGTTVATNALLERKGERMALAVTKGFRDLLHIGNQARPNIFDLEIVCPEVLYEAVVEVRERLLPLQDEQQDEHITKVMGSTGEELLLLQELDEDLLRTELAEVRAKGVTSLAVLLLHSYTYQKHERRVGEIATELGFTHVSLSSAVSPMVKAVPRGYTACTDAYLTPIIQKYLQGFKSGFENELEGVRVSFMQSDGGLALMQEFIGSRAILSGPAGGVVGYAATTYHQQPLVELFDFVDCNPSHITPDRKETCLSNSAQTNMDKDVTTSNTHQNTTENDLSSKTNSRQDVTKKIKSPRKLLPVIGFDMGGTSTDVSRYAGTYEHVFESTTAGITVQAPQLDINTVAAGGGSRLFFHSGMFVVGPESAGANPGPACYKKGGPLAVTDANLMLGRLLPEHFPKIFGPTEDQPLDVAATRTAFADITDKVNSFELSRGSGKKLSEEEVALGFIRVANETMCRPIRALTQAKGHDTSKHILSVFGGAGGQHACAIARSLGMSRVFVHRYAGILSAYGLALADTVQEAQEPCAKTYCSENYAYFSERLQHLESECRTKLLNEGFPTSSIKCEIYLHLRYQGTDCALMCQPYVTDEGAGDSNDDHASSEQPKVRRSSRRTPKKRQTKKATKRGKKQKDCIEEEEEEEENDEGITGYGCFRKSFNLRYKREFGFVLTGRAILVDDIRVRGVAMSGVGTEHCIDAADGSPEPIQTSPVYMEDGLQSAGVYQLSDLKAGHKIQGPAIILDRLSTIFLETGCRSVITSSGDVLIDVSKESSNNNRLATSLDLIQLSIFSHRFMSLAEQMGRVLQRTSISTNIKERLDFSCAVFGPDGGLVSNAPHIPVHLGAMQETVQYQLSELGDDLHDGDVLLSNHPSAGGSHLPDLTVITPVFFKSEPRPVFYVASRGHHADIGGITPGSMPPHSTSIHQEGAVFYSFKLVKKGVFQEAELTEALMAPGKYPGSSGTRNLKDNLSDLRAQVAANHKGIQLVCELIDQYGLDVVQAYMGHIQTSAEMAVRDLFKQVGQRIKDETGAATLRAKDHMDDGSIIAVTIDIDVQQGSAIIDFEGTGPEVWGNNNAPRAITVSAIIYCLRCMLGHDTPLNQGCLAPVSIRIPKGSILNPSLDAAVVGGNVQTSQRVVDVIFKAFGTCAASQGCMNNITFGDDSVGYYETVAGGAGAGPSWHGRSGVHTHMTNTRITDPEILELRYPVQLITFTLNPGTGGSGKYRGGDGVIRELKFRRPLTLCMMTERRVFAPYGLKGGSDGSKGQNLLIRVDGRIIRLPSKSSVDVYKGDVFRLITPGGGGYGRPSEQHDESEEPQLKKQQQTVLRGSVYDYTSAQETA
uniref:5-oxoprolinase-like n=4 Tax=Hirondellea gigas TaxID=1518452 RepID=A0A6A7FY14_9CRUS